VGAVTFRELRYSEYFVDKTLFVKEVFDRKSKVMLITTPPRFGKTINLNTLREYVELQECDDHNFFEGTNIWEYDSYKSHFRKYIVIYISFDGAPTNFKAASSCLQSAVERAYLDHKYLVNSEKLSDSSKLRITRWLNCEVKEEDDIKKSYFSSESRFEDSPWC